MILAWWWKQQKRKKTCQFTCGYTLKTKGFTVWKRKAVRKIVSNTLGFGLLHNDIVTMQRKLVLGMLFEISGLPFIFEAEREFEPLKPGNN